MQRRAPARAGLALSPGAEPALALARSPSGTVKTPNTDPTTRPTTNRPRLQREEGGGVEAALLGGVVRRGGGRT